MNHYKSLKIGNSPLLLTGCTIIAFCATHFYFKDAGSPKITAVIGHILLFPFYIFQEIASRTGFEDISNNAIIIFFVLLISYSFFVFAATKFFEWYKANNN